MSDLTTADVDATVNRIRDRLDRGADDVVLALLDDLAAQARQVATIRNATNNKLETAALIAWKYDHWMMTNLAESNRYQVEVVEAIRSLKEQAS